MREHAIKLFLWRTGISWKFIALVWQTERTRTKSLIKLKKKNFITIKLEYFASSLN